MNFNWHIENLEAADRLIQRFRMIVNPDARPLMVTWCKIIEDDNRKGVLAGKDKRGQDMPPVTYRPDVPTWDRIKIGSKAAAPIRSGTLANNNLSTKEYKKLGGPPLAPRGKYSRVITNLKTEFDPTPTNGRWAAYGYWDQVVTVKGDRFLQYHFHGIGQKLRDLTGVRPEGRAKAKKAAVNWMRDIVRSGSGQDVTAA